jgi:transposase
LQSTIIEAAKLAPRYNQALKAVYEQACLKGHKNRATLAVARKLTAYLLAADRAFFATQANSATAS